ncbi:hypothetical protein BS17DRAFT_796314 [Gyrodon lividus]|nr:hypothetical protein BS17DRAFT_796314 [Gyrodon lividus]
MLDSNFDSPDISPYIVLAHSDLGTGERLQAAQICHSMESTPWNHFQHVIFLPGLFHLKMACADSIWQCFIHPSAVHENETSLMRDIAQLCPKETGIYSTKPGICRCLDCWRAHICNKNPAFSSLDAFALSKPTFDELKALANKMCIHRRKANECDQQLENAMLLNKYFLLYEEMSYAMNSGDIYATHMTNFPVNVHFNYPVSPTVCYHILVNPNGNALKWRAVDWCIELNNLFTKILLESPLIQVYRNIQGTIQKNFDHTHLTRRHGDPNLKKMFDKLLERLMLSSPHVVSVGRKSQHEIKDLNDKG